MPELANAIAPHPRGRLGRRRRRRWQWGQAGNLVPRPRDLTRFGDSATWDNQLSQAAHQLHGLAASLAQAKLGFERTGDPRFKDQARAVLPLYNAWLRKYQDAAVALGQQESVSPFAVTLADFSEWTTTKVIQPVVEGVATGIADTAAAVPSILKLAVVAVAIVGGGILFLRYGGKRAPASDPRD
jgi:hypothetical protein